MLEKHLKLISRKNRIRSKISGSSKRPRLVVYRSNKHIDAQIIDDITSKTIVSASDRELKSTGKKTDLSFSVGELVADKALKANIKEVVFDRGGNIYHGRIKALADGARKKGLIF